MLRYFWLVYYFYLIITFRIKNFNLKFNNFKLLDLYQTPFFIPNLYHCESIK